MKKRATYCYRITIFPVNTCNDFGRHFISTHTKGGMRFLALIESSHNQRAKEKKTRIIRRFVTDEKKKGTNAKLTKYRCRICITWLTYPGSINDIVAVGFGIILDREQKCYVRYEYER